MIAAGEQLRGAARLGAGLLFPAPRPVPLGALALSSGPPAPRPQDHVQTLVVSLHQLLFSGGKTSPRRSPSRVVRDPLGQTCIPWPLSRAGEASAVETALSAGGLCTAPGPGACQPATALQRGAYCTRTHVHTRAHTYTHAHTHTHLCPFSSPPPFFFF